MSNATHHTLFIRGRVGTLNLNVDLELSAPWTLLFGPSGSGKTSILRAACGLLPSAEVKVAGHQNSLPLTPTHLRNMSWAPQHANLFPHLNVRQNIEFASRAIGSLEAHQPLSAEALELFRIGPLASRLPRDLSGGERQRVSLARAFARPNCRLMLLDEPFSGIDRSLRDELLPEMRRWCRERAIPVLSVSHDVEEAFQLQSEVVLLRDGEVEAQGPVSDVLQAERERLLQSLSLPS